jgi:hypothetical protein
MRKRCCQEKFAQILSGKVHILRNNTANIRKRFKNKAAL